MRRGKSIDAEHFVASFRELVNRGASHGAETHYNGIELGGHDSGLSGKDEFATSASAIKQPKQVPIVRPFRGRLVANWTWFFGDGFAILYIDRSRHACSCMFLDTVAFHGPCWNGDWVAN